MTHHKSQPHNLKKRKTHHGSNVPTKKRLYVKTFGDDRCFPSNNNVALVQNKTSLIFTLPNELLVEIFGYLSSSKDVHAILLTCDTFNKVLWNNRKAYLKRQKVDLSSMLISVFTTYRMFLDVELVTRIMTQGVNPMDSDKDDIVHFHRAIKSGRVDIIECMAKQPGVNINQKDKYHIHIYI